MKKRIVTGFFILLGVVGFLLLKQFSNLFFDALILVIMYGSLYEVGKVYKTDGKEIDYLIYLLPAIFCLIFNLQSNTFVAVGYVILIVLLYAFYLLSAEIVEYGLKRKNDTDEKNVEVLNKTLFDKTKSSMMVCAYPVVMLTFLFALNHIEYNASYMGLIFAFACAMTTDSLALVFGKMLGKKKFIPEVSPNKTIAGVFGGFFGGIMAAIICLICFVYFPHFSETVMDAKEVYILIFSALGILGALADQLGDLIASALKRKVGVKDYGHIFPGHGGLMDRVDGLMFTVAITYICFALFLL